MEFVWLWGGVVVCGGCGGGESGEGGEGNNGVGSPHSTGEPSGDN